MGITVVGLGPGPYGLLTLDAARVLESAAVVSLRTARHPTVDEFPASIRWTSFDALYDELPDFDAVYAAIVGRLLDAARAGADVVYAVPGDPAIGERTVALLRERAAAEGIALRLVPGVSFVGPILGLLPDADADNLQVFDALHLPDVDPTVPLLAYQVYSPGIASDLKLDLLDRYPAEHIVHVIRHAGLAGEQETRALPLAELDRGAGFDHLTSVYVPAIRPPEASLQSVRGLRAIIARLRGPNGCPWDRQQTHASIRKYVLEEAYEVADAIDEGEPAELKEELGDLLLQVLLHAQIADDAGEFDLDDVVRRLAEKLVGRHPHVFGEATARTAAEVERNWEALKRAEKGDSGPPPSALKGIPRSMPGLRAALETFERAVDAGASPPPAEDAWHRIEDSLRTLRETTASAAAEDALGQALLALAALAGARGMDPERALERALRAVGQRFREAEARARDTGRPLDFRLG